MTNIAARRAATAGAEILGGLIFAAFLVWLWHVAAVSGRVALIPTPGDSIRAAWEMVSGPVLLSDVVPSAARAIGGFLIGGAIGVIVGGVIGFFPRLDPWLGPTLEFLRATPLPAILPMAILILGATDTMRVSVIAFATFWPVMISARDGTRAIEPLYLQAGRVAGLDRRRMLIRIVLPASLPAVFAGLRVGLGIALAVMVISEMIGATSGLGFQVLNAQRMFNMPDMVAGVILLGLLGILLTSAFAIAERWALGWYRGMKEL